MTTEHSPEPWEAQCFDTLGADNVRSLGNGCLVALVVSTNSSKAANARRIAACVNACKGIATEHLESLRPEPICDELVELAEIMEKLS